MANGLIDKLKIVDNEGNSYVLGTEISIEMDNIINPEDTENPTVPIPTVVTQAYNTSVQNSEEVTWIKENSYIKKVLSWKHFNVRAFGERGHPNLQGFTEDGGVPVYMDRDIIEGIEQACIVVPGDPIPSANLANSGRMNAVFPDSLWLDMFQYGARYSGRSKLGTDGIVNGYAGGFTGVLDRFNGSQPAARIVVRFIGRPGADGEPYVNIDSISSSFFTTTTKLDGSVEGLPVVKCGEWFDWDVVVTPGFHGSTLFDMYINGIMVPTKLKYVVISNFDGPGSCLKIGAWFDTPGGRYSYHSHVGVTIMQEPSHKIFTKADLDSSSIYTIIPPEGSFNLVCEASEDIDNVPVGHSLQIIAVNQRGTLDFRGKANFLINSLQGNVIPVWKRMNLEGVNITPGKPNYSMEVPLPY